MNQMLKEIVDSLHCPLHKQGTSLQKMQEQELHNAQDRAPNFLKDTAMRHQSKFSFSGLANKFISPHGNSRLISRVAVKFFEITHKREAHKIIPADLVDITSTSLIDRIAVRTKK